jgi:hypothetical protein
MLTIEVNGEFITWPDDFAFTMMKYYRKHDVPFLVHRNSINTGRDTCAKNTSLAKQMKSIDFRENRDCGFALISNK